MLSVNAGQRKMQLAQKSLQPLQYDSLQESLQTVFRPNVRFVPIRSEPDTLSLG